MIVKASINGVSIDNKELKNYTIQKPEIDDLLSRIFERTLLSRRQH